MGIYSVTPGLPEWQTTKPYFDEVKIHPKMELPEPLLRIPEKKS
jgi:hypothetical protein